MQIAIRILALLTFLFSLTALAISIFDHKTVVAIASLMSVLASSFALNKLTRCKNCNGSWFVYLLRRPWLILLGQEFALSQIVSKTNCPYCKTNLPWNFTPGLAWTEYLMLRSGRESRDRFTCFGDGISLSLPTQHSRFRGNSNTLRFTKSS